MTFLNPWLLSGVILAGVPLIIHFLNKTKYRIEPFGAMMFLQAAIKVRAQRLKLRQLLLLLLRCLVFLLIAIGLARPVMRPKSGGTADGPTTHVLIFDGSLSMQQGQGSENAFRKATESALRIVDTMRRGDNMQIIWADERPRPLLAEPSFDQIFLRNTIRGLEAGIGTMNSPRAFEQALWSLAHSTLPQHRIYLLTDGQSSGWQADNAGVWEGLGEHRQLLPIQPFTYVLKQRPDNVTENLAVRAIFPQAPLVDIFRQTRFVVELANYGIRTRTVDVRFSVNGTLQEDRTVSVPPGVHTVFFDHRFTESGSQFVTVDLPRDDLPADDSRSHVVQVIDQVPILLIEGNISTNPWRSDGGLITLALEACTQPGQAGLFRVTSRPQTEMDGISTEFLEQFKVVILANVTSLSEYFMFALERFVERGGGLLIGGGDQPVPSEYNRLFKDGRGLLPALLGDIATYDQRFFRPTFPAGQASFVLDAFDLSRTRVLNNVKVEKFWRCRKAEDAVVLATFGDAPFLVYKPYGKGRSILWTTSLSHDWTNFPATQDFLPLVQNLLAFLAGTDEQDGNVRPGEALVYTAARPRRGSPPATDTTAPLETADACTLTKPDGTTEQLPLVRESGRWGAEWNNPRQLGVYTIEAPGMPSQYFAVQPYAEESNLQKLPPGIARKLAESYPFTTVSSEANLAAEIRKEIAYRQWWQPFVLATVALLCLESFFSWRFST